MSVLILGVAACAPKIPVDRPAEETAAVPGELIRPRARPAGAQTVSAAPPRNARTAEQFDTTTQAEREAATAPVVSAERSLGTTVASLGAPTEPGFWLKTPLVSAEGPGRVVYPVTGKSVAVTLIPIEGPVTAGSRLSLSALRLLEAPLTGLPEVEVYAGG